MTDPDTAKKHAAATIKQACSLDGVEFIDIMELAAPPHVAQFIKMLRSVQSTKESTVFTPNHPIMKSIPKLSTAPTTTQEMAEAIAHAVSPNAPADKVAASAKACEDTFKVLKSFFKSAIEKKSE